MSDRIRPNEFLGTSLAMSTAFTPGIVRAASRLTLRISACGWTDRTVAPTACFGQRSGAYSNSPRTLALTSWRRRGAPTPTAVGSVGCVGKVVDFVPNRPQAARAAPATRLPARNVRLLSRRSGESDTPVVPFLGIHFLLAGDAT